jgi:hypothetical protein
MSNDQVWTLSALPILAAWAKNAKVAVSLVVRRVGGWSEGFAIRSIRLGMSTANEAGCNLVEGPIGVELRLEEHLAVHDDGLGVCRLSATAFGDV